MIKLIFDTEKYFEHRPGTVLNIKINKHKQKDEIPINNNQILQNKNLSFGKNINNNFWNPPHINNVNDGMNVNYVITKDINNDNISSD